MKKILNLPKIANHIPPAQGRLLVSEPFLYDPNFNRTVVLLTEHDANGTLGFILNKKLDLCVDEVLEIDGQTNIPVYYGGPVQNSTLHFIHREPYLIQDSVEVAHGIYWGGDFSIVQELITNHQLDNDNFKFFLGYSGWTTNQLNLEIEEKTWFVSQTNEVQIFTTPPDDIWKDVLNNLGMEFRLLANSPRNPHWN